MMAQDKMLRVDQVIVFAKYEGDPFNSCLDI